MTVAAAERQAPGLWEVIPRELFDTLREFRDSRRAGTIVLRLDNEGVVRKIEETYVRRVEEKR